MFHVPKYNVFYLISYENKYITRLIQDICELDPLNIMEFWLSKWGQNCVCSWKQLSDVC